jgi:hypothetical protein
MAGFRELKGFCMLLLLFTRDPIPFYNTMPLVLTDADV